MTPEVEEIRNAIRAVVAEMIPVQTQWGTVIKVTGNTCSVKLSKTETEMPNVFLGFDDGDRQVIPEDGSKVLIGIVNNLRTGGFILMAEKVKEMRYYADKTVFNKGLKKGLVLLEKVVQKLNNLEQQHNKALLDFVTHTHIDPLSGATGVIVVPPQATSIIPTQESELENTKIIQ